MTYHQLMIEVDIAAARAHFSRCPESVENGKTVLVRRRNVPIAELRSVPIRPVPKRPAQPHPVGIDRGMAIPSGFFEPLPDDPLDACEGRFGGRFEGRKDQVRDFRRGVRRPRRAPAASPS